MSTSQRPVFFSEVKDWSERKLHLLENYIKAASKIMARGGEVYYIDGFAGAGIYEDGSQGSPIRAAELALAYKKDRKPYILKCINVEQKRNNFANLQKHTAIYEETVLNLPGTFVDNIDRILQVVRNQPVICFLDPFGVKGINWEAVTRIINRGSYCLTDLWIRFDVSALQRLYGCYSNAAKSFEILQEVFGNDDGKALYDALSGETDKKALRMYKSQLADCFKGLRGTGYSASYQIRTLKNDQFKYYLVFATANKKGAILASEVVCGIEETYQRERQELEKKQRLQLSLFPDPTEEEIFQEKVKELSSDIWKICKGATLSRMDVYIRVWEKWFGKIKGRHITAALKQLKDGGYLIKIEGLISQDETKLTFRN